MRSRSDTSTTAVHSPWWTVRRCSTRLAGRRTPFPERPSRSNSFVGFPSMSDVLALVLTFNARDALRECLRALSAQTEPLAEILVVDNASAETVDDVVAEFPTARLLQLED